jgi:hypothetical protein
MESFSQAEPGRARRVPPDLQRSRYKVSVLDEIHMLSLSVLNALRKALKAQPAHVKFIFKTTESSHDQKENLRSGSFLLPLILLLMLLLVLVRATRPPKYNNRSGRGFPIANHLRDLLNEPRRRNHASFQSLESSHLAVGNESLFFNSNS